MGSVSLEKLREKFPLAKYEPEDGCPHCAGTGELVRHPGFPCLCAFVPQGETEIIGPIVGQFGWNYRNG